MSRTTTGTSSTDAAASPIDAIRSAVASLKGLRILDIGCGEGVLARQLAQAGAAVTGIDPLEGAIARARELVPQARFETAGAEALPFPDQAFDVAVMVNSLHHVPIAAMSQALRESTRVVKPEGRVIVLEPLCSGSYFAAVRIAEDETEVRTAAQAALAKAVADGILNLVYSFTYIRRDTLDTADQFIARVIAVDPEHRAPIVEAMRPKLHAAVLAEAVRTPDGKLLLEQPIKVDIFRVS